MTYLTITSSSTGNVIQHNGPIVARWPLIISLRTRLALAVALSVALVISGLTVIGTRLAERRMEDDLRETAYVTAVAVADDLELRPEQVAPETIAPVLHEFMTAAPSLRAIWVFRLEDAGPALLASTSSDALRPLDLIERVARTGEPLWQQPTELLAMVAVPVIRSDRVVGSVAVTVSFAAIEQLRRQGRFIALGGATAAILGITLLIHLLARRLIHRPLQDVAGAMRRVAAGDLTARAPVDRRDELGELALRLNDMLCQLEDLHRSLNERVAAATEELRQRNQQLVRSYESVLDLRETAARAQQLAAVGQTMANVAHQIGTPLNLASGHVQLLKQQVSDPAVQRRLHIVEDQVARVASSVRSLLERARPIADERPVDVGALLARLMEAVRSRSGASGITLDVDIADGLPVVLADDTQLELALLNIVSNALDAMPDGGRLTAQIAPTPTGLRLEIRDTGTGIPPELVSKIFDPWVTTKPAGRGAGLGLSITRDVIERLGGTISATSTPGKGATFVVELPGAPAEATPAL
ncbi:MAG TPA: ATP-binding protein [Vicinamibacterales bacterium]|nr:ATP-binding protein [Vicinamibacterales bacterium]